MVSSADAVTLLAAGFAAWAIIPHTDNSKTNDNGFSMN
jgi:hypothetical protein